MYCHVGGGQEDTSDAFQALSALPDVGAALDRAGETSALCVRADDSDGNKTAAWHNGLFYSINHILGKKKIRAVLTSTCRMLKPIPLWTTFSSGFHVTAWDFSICWE